MKAMFWTISIMAGGLFAFSDAVNYLTAMF